MGYKLILLRHGESQWNAKNLFTGWVDVDLSEKGKTEAARAGQLLNLNSLANECGISQPTAKSWVSVLESSYIVYQLQPYFSNFNKRVTKSSKLYFYDTGLLCYLLKLNEFMFEKLLFIILFFNSASCFQIFIDNYGQFSRNFCFS